MKTEAGLMKKFAYFKQKALKLLSKKKYNNAIDAAKVSCELAKRYNLVFMDDTLEQFTEDISEQLFAKSSFTPTKGRIVFYDNIAVDGITLTQQYIQALAAWDVEFLFLTVRNLRSSRSKKIYDELSANPKVTIKMPDKKLSSIEVMDFYKRSIDEYKPEIALIHTQATDVEGVSVLNSFPNVRKYYIEMADHNFWLGAKMMDYCISFRSFGQIIAERYRKIPAHKIFIQPYYPIINTVQFAGLPSIDNKQTINILSGGRVSKIYDEQDTFLTFIKNILTSNPEVKFYFIGSTQGASSGPVGYIHSYIKKHSLENQFIILEFRKDLMEVMKRMDIYIGTFPIGGGLMTQIAAYCKLPIVQYALSGLSSSLAEFLADDIDVPQIVFNEDIDGFYNEVNRLIKDKNWRKEKSEAQYNALMSPEKFNLQLRSLILHNDCVYKAKYYDIAVENIRKKAIEAENLYMHQYEQILFKSKYYLKYHFIQYVFNLIKLFYYTDKKWFWKNMKKVIAIKLKKSWE